MRVQVAAKRLLKALMPCEHVWPLLNKNRLFAKNNMFLMKLKRENE